MPSFFIALFIAASRSFHPDKNWYFVILVFLQVHVMFSLLIVLYVKLSIAFTMLLEIRLNFSSMIKQKFPLIRAHYPKTEKIR